MTNHHLIRVGAMGQIGRFAAVDTIGYQRHHRVIVRTRRGLEVGEVLVPPAIDGPGVLKSGSLGSGSLATSTRALGPLAPGFDFDRVDGQVLRGMTPQDHLLEARLETKRQAAYKACVKLLERLQLPDLLIDVEHLFDGQGLYFYFLGEVSLQLEQTTHQLAETYESKVEFRKFTETLLAGCGPDCGTKAAAGGTEAGGCENCDHCDLAKACKSR
ncbi:MAG: PSP1 C-terminal domain-containing protein [Pirellulales bacterium]